MVLNGTWGYYPYFSIESYIIMIFLTLLIESVVFWRTFKGEKRMIEYLVIILVSNIAAGTVGFIILLGFG